MGDQGLILAPRLRPLAGLQCQAWHSGPIVTSRPSPPRLGPLHSLRVTYMDYMSHTFATCHLQYLKAVPSARVSRVRPPVRPCTEFLCWVRPPDGPCPEFLPLGSAPRDALP